MNRKNWLQSMAVAIPKGVYWSEHRGKFYAMEGRHLMPFRFQAEWYARRREFPDRFGDLACLTCGTPKVHSTTGLCFECWMETTKSLPEDILFRMEDPDPTDETALLLNAVAALET